MNLNEMRQFLATVDPDDGYVSIDVSDLAGLKAADIPEGVEIEVQVHTSNDTADAREIYLSRGTRSPLMATIRLAECRKCWNNPIEISRYHRLLQALIEKHIRDEDPLEFLGLDNQEDWIYFNYAIHSPTDDVVFAYQKTLDTKEALDQSMATFGSEVDRLINSFFDRLA